MRMLDGLQAIVCRDCQILPNLTATFLPNADVEQENEVNRGAANRRFAHEVVVPKGRERWTPAFGTLLGLPSA